GRAVSVVRLVGVADRHAVPVTVQAGERGQQVISGVRDERGVVVGRERAVVLEEVQQAGHHLQVGRHIGVITEEVHVVKGEFDDVLDPVAQLAAAGNGIKHVIELTFDNVHFFRDNPNVPSDLQMMPSLLHFFEHNGTFASNNHTPLIAHTGDDLLTTFTGLYGDRHGMPISNSYQAYNADGTTDPAGSFAYWTDPIFDTAAHPNAGHDTNPSLVYAASPPATTSPPPTPDTTTPAPWVPFTRAGCNVGEAGSGEQRGGHPQGVRRELARGPAARRRYGHLQGRRDRGLCRHRRALR